MKLKERKEKKRSKYRGFGETSDPPTRVVKVKKVKKPIVEDPVSEVVKRKNEKLTIEEKNLMEELMKCAKSDAPVEVSENETTKPTSQTNQVSRNIVEFEEQQTLSQDASE